MIHTKKKGFKPLTIANGLIIVLLVGLIPIHLKAQSIIQVKGQVVGEDNIGLPGATVMVKESSEGTVTDVDGYFSLEVSEGKILQVSFVGYVSKEVIATLAPVRVELILDIGELSEVIVVGYGEKSKSTLTGAVSQTEGKTLTKNPVPNMSNALSGRVSGLVTSNSSGEPGSDGSRLLIRGRSTTGDNSPLIVIDGVAQRLGGLERLDPNDIESVSVLKDASAAIYGAQAANGVIIVTTKRGKIGSPLISFSHNQGFSSPTRLPDLADAAAYAQILNEIAYYESSALGLNQIYSDEEIEKFRNGSDPVNYQNTDWLNEAIKDYSVQNQTSLTMQGGNEKVKYYSSIGRIFQDGIYKNGATEYGQYNFRTALDADIKDRLSIGIDVNFRQEDRQYPYDNSRTIFRSIFRTQPNRPVYYPFGSENVPADVIEGARNPIVIVSDAGGTDNQRDYYLNSTFRFKYELPFLDGLNIDGFHVEDRSFRQRKKFSQPWTVYRKPEDGTDLIPILGGPDTGKPELFQSQQNGTLRTSNLRVAFDKSVGNHNISSFIAYEQNVTELTYFGTLRRNFLTNALHELSQGGAAPTDTDNEGSSSFTSRRNFFGRVAYDYDHKYLAEIQARYDGSYKFSEDKRFGFFPSMSVGWVISRESWMSNFSALDFLKARFSWGVLGNDRIDPFQYSDSYILQENLYALGDPVTSYTGIIPIKLGNPNITWETSIKSDLGIEATVFRHIDLEFDLFREERNNILIPRNASVPQISGIVNGQSIERQTSLGNLIPDENFGQTENKGFEIQMSYWREYSNGLHLSTSANFTYAKNEVINIDEPVGLLDYQKQAGKSLGSQLLYHSTGIFKTNQDLINNPRLPGQGLGDLIFEDINGDGNIDADDRVRKSKSDVPTMIFGYVIDVRWKNFELNILLQGQAGSVLYLLPESGKSSNFFNTWAENRWSPLNESGTYPRVDTRASASVNGGQNPNDFWLHNTSFIRLKNVNLSYVLPSNLVGKLGVKNAKIYVNGFNIYTLTSVRDFDPEGNDQEAFFYPQQKIFNVGLNFQF